MIDQELLTTMYIKLTGSEPLDGCFMEQYDFFNGQWVHAILEEDNIETIWI
jgi:hypothetical protein